MTGLSRRIGAFVRDDSGATAIEYGLVGVLVSVAIISALLLVQSSLLDIYTFVQDEMQKAVGG